MICSRCDKKMENGKGETETGERKPEKGGRRMEKEERRRENGIPLLNEEIPVPQVFSSVAFRSIPAGMMLDEQLRIFEPSFISIWS